MHCPESGLKWLDMLYKIGNIKSMYLVCWTNYILNSCKGANSCSEKGDPMFVGGTRYFWWSKGLARFFTDSKEGETRIIRAPRGGTIYFKSIKRVSSLFMSRELYSFMGTRIFSCRQR